MYFNWFIGAERHGEDVLTADEAHRMRETQAGRLIKASLLSGNAQVDELIDAARVPVSCWKRIKSYGPASWATSLLLKSRSARAGGTSVLYRRDDRDLHTQAVPSRSRAEAGGDS